MQALKTKRIGDVLPQQEIVTALFTETIGDALARMTKHNLTALPVGSLDRILGFVDVLDLIGFLVQECYNKLGVSLNIHMDTVRNLMKRNWEFDMRQVIEALDLSRRNPFKVIDVNDPLDSALVSLRQGIHRVAVVDKGQFIGVLTQSDILRWVASNCIEAVPDIKVEDVRWKSDAVLYTSPQTPAIDAFLQMWESKITSIGVVQQGRLQLILSASDVKVSVAGNGISQGQCGLENEKSFELLVLPVMEFIGQVHRRNGKPADYLITCTPESSLREVIQRVASERIHRLYICDLFHKPVGVIALTDIIREITLEI